MTPQTEELLYYLLWTADRLMRPTWRNLNDSFETWAWRNRLSRRLAELARRKLIERHPEPSLARIVRLTQQGRHLALGGRDPVNQWNRPWDGKWRLILFDVPEVQSRLRQQFRRVLRQFHFGHLQGSVWASPDPPERVRTLLGESDVEAKALLVIEGRPATGETDQSIVDGAWDFPLIRRRYLRYLSFLDATPPQDSRLIGWSRQENNFWQNAVGVDPLLPRALLPSDYLGFEALRRRQSILAKLARQTTIS